MRSTQDTEGGAADSADPAGAHGGSSEHPEHSVSPMSASRPRRALSLVAGAASRLLVVASLAGLAAGGGWLVTRAATPPSSATTSTIPGLDVKAAQVAPGSEAPVQAEPAGGRAPAGAAEPSESADTGEARQSQAQQQGSAADMLRAWAERAEPVVGVPSRALLAYGRAELAMRAAQPDCRLSWATLAAIGRIESDHGRYGGAVLGADGYPSEPIIGVPLDGSPGVARISDTDNGVYDGDPVHDRAVGPMQFIPSTWMRWASDGNGDGVGSPQQIDDAALAAARYLCTGARDMGTAEGWWQGVLSYNHSVEYAKKVFAVAETYANRASGLTAS